jgi:hypothetical protein
MELSQQYRQLDDLSAGALYRYRRYSAAHLRHLQDVQETLPRPASRPLLSPTTFPSTVLQLDASASKACACATAANPRRDYRPRGGIAWLCQQGEALNSVQPGEPSRSICATSALSATKSTDRYRSGGLPPEGEFSYSSGTTMSQFFNQRASLVNDVIEEPLSPVRGITSPGWRATRRSGWWSVAI